MPMIMNEKNQMSIESKIHHVIIIENFLHY